MRCTCDRISMSCRIWSTFVMRMILRHWLWILTALYLAYCSSRACSYADGWAYTRSHT